MGVLSRGLKCTPMLAGKQAGDPCRHRVVWPRPCWGEQPLPSLITNSHKHPCRAAAPRQPGVIVAFELEDFCRMHMDALMHPSATEYLFLILRDIGSPLHRAMPDVKC